MRLIFHAIQTYLYVSTDGLNLKRTLRISSFHDKGVIHRLIIWPRKLSHGLKLLAVMTVPLILPLLMKLLLKSSNF